MTNSSSSGNAYGELRPLTAIDSVLLLFLASCCFAASVGACTPEHLGGSVLFAVGGLSAAFLAHSTATRWVAAVIIAWGLWHTLALDRGPVSFVGLSVSPAAAVLCAFLLHTCISAIRGQICRWTAWLLIFVTATLALCSLPGTTAARGLTPETGMAWVFALGFLGSVGPLQRCLGSIVPRYTAVACCSLLVVTLACKLSP